MSYYLLFKLRSPTHAVVASLNVCRIAFYLNFQWANSLKFMFEYMPYCLLLELSSITQCVIYV